MLTSASVPGSTIVMVAVRVSAVTMYLPFGLTGVWIGNPPTGPEMAPLTDHSSRAD